MHLFVRLCALYSILLIDSARWQCSTSPQWLFVFVVYCNNQIENHKLDWNVESRVGSLDNASHKPGGGEKKVSRPHMTSEGHHHML